MSKPLLVYQAPISTRSGYGDHSRDLLKSLKDLDLYEIKIISTRWGHTPMDQLTPQNEFHNWILKNVITELTQQPDVYIQVTVPNEFQAIGKYNIGVTAGIESTIVAKDWVDGCNKMDLVITTSEHSKKVLLQTIYQERRRETNQVVNEFKIQKPIEVLFEGCDYKETKGLTLLDSIKEDFCFLFVGHWLQGDLYHDRKDVGGLIQTFLAAFNKNTTNKPALILKTSFSSFSIRDREEVLKKIENISNTINGGASIYLLHGDLNEEEMWELYNHPKVKSMISFTHGEGFGRPLLEFSLTGKPVIASNWSGHVDFLNEGAILLEGELKNVHESAANQFLLKESQWFHVNYSKAAIILQNVVKNYNSYLASSKKLSEINKQKFSMDNMNKKLKEILDKNIKFVKKVELKLPSLKKKEEATLPQLNLPKLKKIES